MRVDESRRTQMLKGVLDLCVLAVLRHGPQYGYGLVGTLQEHGFELLAEGSVYPLLSRLEKANLVSSFKAPSADGPRRKYYELTDDGRQALDNGINDWSAVSRQVDGLFAGLPSSGARSEPVTSRQERSS